MATFATLDHSNLQSEAFAVTFAFPVLATIAVGLRIYSRSLTRTFGYDDWFICVAAVFFWAETFVTYKFIQIGYIGFHVYDIPFTTIDEQMAQKYGYAAELIYVPILGLIKTSIMLFLFRLTGQKKAVKRAILGLLIINGVLTIVNWLFVLFQCLPIAAIWDRAAYPNAKCLPFSTVTTAFASVSVFTDALALILPTWIVYDLKISRKQKLLLISILSFGLVTVVSGLVRLVLLAHFSANPPKDFTHTILFCISSIEVGLAFVAACAPYMKPLVLRIAPKFFGSTRFGKTTGRATRPVYELSQSRTWKGTQTMTHVDASGDDFGARILKEGGLNDKTDIMMTMETEVKWQDNPNGTLQTSTESLV